MENLIKRAAFLWRMMMEDGKYDNGDDEPIGFMLHAMAKKPITTKQLDDFEESLIKLISADVERQMSKYNVPISRCYVRLSVDYHPEKILSAAADAAGISHNNFPIKSSVSIGFEKENINVSYGYSSNGENHYHSDGKWLVLDTWEFVQKYVSHKFDGTDMPEANVCGPREWPGFR